MKSPIRKLLVLTNQLSSDSLIYFAYLICFDNEKNKYASMKIKLYEIYTKWNAEPYVKFYINHVLV